MAKTVFVKPAPGLIVRDPVTMQPLPEEGLLVEKSTHWIRRAKAGDVTFCEPTAEPTAKNAKSAKE